MNRNEAQAGHRRARRQSARSGPADRGRSPRALGVGDPAFDPHRAAPRRARGLAVPRPRARHRRILAPSPRTRIEEARWRFPKEGTLMNEIEVDDAAARRAAEIERKLETLREHYVNA